MTTDLVAHWNEAYATKGEQGVSWFEESPDFSVGLIRELAAGRPLSVIDIGGGASRLVDVGLSEGWTFAVLDISEGALETARKRLGAHADAVEWIAADVTKWRPWRSFDVWHDRAAFHFLTQPEDRAAYVDRLQSALKPGGHAIIATFAPDGPERCSGLPVERYDGAQLAKALGDGFQLVAEHRKMHRTPWGTEQSFQFSVLTRL
jgi:trans-aconitate methyltransferase